MLSFRKVLFANNKYILGLTLVLGLLFPNHFAIFDELTSKTRSAKLETERLFSLTDKAIEKLHPWRSDIPLKVFSSRIRFQIRVNDMREKSLKSETTIDNVMDFFNPIIYQMIQRYTTEIDLGKKSQTWQ